MVELPTKVLNINGFTRLFDSFFIGSNNLTQLTLAWTATLNGLPSNSTNAAPPS